MIKSIAIQPFLYGYNSVHSHLIKIHVPILYCSELLSTKKLIPTNQRKFYALHFCVSRCLWYFIKLYPIYTLNISISTFSRPLRFIRVYRRSCFITPNTPSAWILLCFFISFPISVPRFSSTFFWNSSLIGFSVIVLLPDFVQSLRLLHSAHPAQPYIWLIFRYFWFSLLVILNKGIIPQ